MEEIVEEKEDEEMEEKDEIEIDEDAAVMQVL